MGHAFVQSNGHSRSYAGVISPNGELNQMNLSPPEYQTIGENIIARLLSLNGR